MIKEMSARFGSRCAATGQWINKGDKIEYDTVTKTARLAGTGTEATQGTVSRSHTRVNTFAFGSADQGGYKVYTRNVRGRCEDAPCCGCCTI